MLHYLWKISVDFSSYFWYNCRRFIKSMLGWAIKSLVPQKVIKYLMAKTAELLEKAADSKLDVNPKNTIAEDWKWPSLPLKALSSPRSD